MPIVYHHLAGTSHADCVLETLRSAKVVDVPESGLWQGSVNGPLEKPATMSSPVERVVFARVASLDPQPLRFACQLMLCGGLPGGKEYVPLRIEGESAKDKRPLFIHQRIAVGDCLAIERSSICVENGRGVALVATADAKRSAMIYNFGHRDEAAGVAPTAECVADCAIGWLGLAGAKEHALGLSLCNDKLREAMVEPRGAPALLERLALLFLRRQEPEAALGYANAAMRLRGDKPGVRGTVVAAAAAASLGRLASARHLLRSVRSWLVCGVHHPVPESPGTVYPPMSAFVLRPVGADRSLAPNVRAELVGTRLCTKPAHACRIGRRIPSSRLASRGWARTTTQTAAVMRRTSMAAAASWSAAWTRPSGYPTLSIASTAFRPRPPWRSMATQRCQS